MRFWPFGKRQRGATDDAPAAGAASAPGAVPAPERPPTGAWRRLPALRPTSASLALTAPVQRLTDTLTSTQRTQVAASELSHARTLTGPTGSVAGLVRPHRNVQHEGSGGPLTFAHAPDPIEATDAVPIRPWASTQRLPAPSVRSSGTTAAPAAVSTAAPASPSALPSAPARVMPARATPATTVVDSAPAAAPVSPAAPAPPLAVPAAQRLPEAAPSAGSSAITSAASAEATVERSIVEAPATNRPDAPTLGSTRIVRRIGAPMHARPASMVDAVPAESAPVQALPVAAASATPEPSAPAAAEPARSVTAQAPGALPARPARSMASSSAPTTRGSGGPAPVQRLDAPADAPLVGSGTQSIQRLQHAAPTMTIPTMASPEEPAAPRPDVVPARRGVQRAPESVPPTVRSELEPVLGDSLSDVKVHRGPETGAAARSIQAKAFTTGGAVYMPDEHGSTASGEGRKILSHELTHVVQQRALGGSLPNEDSTEGARLENEARVVGGQAPVPTRPVAPTARPAAAGPAQRLAGSPMPSPSRSLGSVPAGQDTPSAGSALPLSTQATIAATVQAAATRAGVPSSTSSAPVASPFGSSPFSGSGAPASATTTGGVQRLTEASTNADAPSAAATSSASPTTSSVSAPESSSATDLDDLERQLYPRIRTRLKSDLLADRERSGRLFDR